MRGSIKAGLPKMPGARTIERMPENYRPNVAAIVQGPGGLLLIGQRSDFPECWQFPQGGIDAGESKEDALRREVLEEIALPPGAYEVTARRGPYRYDYPQGLDRRGFRGQEQTYFLCSILGNKLPVIELHKSCGEFTAVHWVPVDDFPVHLVPPMKQAVYREILRDFFGASPDSH